jgi:hypothetical protein
MGDGDLSKIRKAKRRIQERTCELIGGGHGMTAIQYLDQPPVGWFVLDVMKGGESGLEWVALMVDVDPSDLKSCICDFPALLYVPERLPAWIPRGA